MSLHRTKDQKIAIFTQAFRGRTDIHGTREVGKGRARCEKSPPDKSLIAKHLCGKRPIGVYPLVEDRAWFAAIDLDEMDTDPVMALQQLATGLGIHPLIERSKSKGWHLWFFADESGWDARHIRQLLRWMTAEINLPGVEVFPKQDRLESGGFGNFIFLPFDGSLVPRGRTLFVEPTRWLPPVTNQWDALADRHCYSEAQIADVLTSIDVSDESSDGRHGATPESNAIDPISRSSLDRTPTQPAVSQTAHEVGGVASHNPSQSFRGLPPCAVRMLTEGVSHNQRVVCFRLAVHMHRLGIPEDLARVMLEAWAAKNQPPQSRRIITKGEIARQVRDGYSGRYRGYGCEDPMIARYCGESCPVRTASQRRDVQRQTSDTR